MDFKIEKSIPAPQSHHLAKYPWPQMEVGDSIFFEGQSTSRKNGGNNNAVDAAYSWGKDNNRKFTVRTENGGVRIWRIE